MKADTERKRYHTEKLHKRKSRLHVHLSKDLRSKLKAKKRSILVRKGDTVKVMRGPGKGTEAKVGDVNTVRRKVYVEGVVAKSAKGREVPSPLEPSNLLLISLEPTRERKELFSEDAFKKKEVPKKAEAKAEPKPAPGPEPLKPMIAKPETSKPETANPKPAKAASPEAPKK
ncbi:MAG: 50S ribosomal protein L24 [Candidatus Micrarchaeota archaeon]